MNNIMGLSFINIQRRLQDRQKGPGFIRQKVLWLGQPALQALIIKHREQSVWKREKKGKTEDRSKIKETCVKHFLKGEKEKWEVCLESFINQNVHVWGLWKNTRVPEVKILTENIETRHKTAGKSTKPCITASCLILITFLFLYKIIYRNPGLDYLISAWLAMTIV